MSATSTITLRGQNLVTARRVMMADLECILGLWADRGFVPEDIARLHEDLRLQRALGGWPFDSIDDAPLSAEQCWRLVEIVCAESDAHGEQDRGYEAALAGLLEQVLEVADLAA